MATGLLERIMGAPLTPQANYGPGEDYWYLPRSMASATGLNVTPDAAMACSAVYACVAAISEDVGSIPLHLFRRLSRGGRERVQFSDLPLSRKLGLEPNRWQTSM